MEFIKEQLHEILKIVAKLEKEYQNRKFTLDGHLFGSIGEIYASTKYNLKLAKSSTKGYDALDKNNNQVQIKVTQRDKVGMRHSPQKLLVLKLDRKTLDFQEIYYGDGEKAWNLANKINSAGQRFISLKKLMDLEQSTHNTV